MPTERLWPEEAPELAQEAPPLLQLSAGGAVTGAPAVPILYMEAGSVLVSFGGSMLHATATAWCLLL